VNPENPLTARVTVNRLWERFFGTGIVKTSEDFGRQGETPSHPELLDWLATEFIRTGWDVKAMEKLIVMSAYLPPERSVDEPRLEKDPFNRLLARGPRFRMDAEMIRDQALGVSGLLNPEIGGPSVYPVQVANLWKEIGFLRRKSAWMSGRPARDRSFTAAACTRFGGGFAPIRPSRRLTRRAARFASRGGRARTRRCRPSPA
jgi:hypothetical protein